MEEEEEEEKKGGEEEKEEVKEQEVKEEDKRCVWVCAHATEFPLLLKEEEETRNISAVGRETR